jgi:hypothetical protein
LIANEAMLTAVTLLSIPLYPEVSSDFEILKYRMGWLVIVLVFTSILVNLGFLSYTLLETYLKKINRSSRRPSRTPIPKSTSDLSEIHQDRRQDGISMQFYSEHKRQNTKNDYQNVSSKKQQMMLEEGPPMTEEADTSNQY